MRRGLLRASAVAGALAIALSIGGVAAAAPSGRIVQIESADGKISMVFQANDLPPGASVDPASVTVSVEGTDVPATAKPVGAGDRPVTRTALLVMDVSGSMAGTGIAAAKQAASAFLSAVPTDVSVGLVTFGDTARVAVRPTKDRAALAKAVQGLEARGSTALYDATVLAVDTVGATGPRNILILSDGADEGSRADLSAALARVRASKVSLDAVSFGTKNAQVEPLRQLSGAASGRVLATDQAGDLAGAFEQVAQVISNQLEVTAQLPAGLQSGSANVTVSATVGGAHVTDTAFATLVAAAPKATDQKFGPTPVPVDRTATLVSDKTLPIAFGVLFLGLLAILAVALSAANRSQDKHGRVRRRLSIYTLTGRQPVKQEETTTALGNNPVARSAVEFAGKVVKQRDFEGALSQRLEAAGVPLRVAEWMLIHIGVAVGLAFVMLLISGGAIAPTLVGLGLGLALPWLYLSLKESRRTSAFLAQLPDTLQLVAGSLSAGYSMPQALDTVVREGQQPITSEFNRALVEARLGVPIEDALEGVADRMKSKDFAWVVMAIRIQREVGGNLAELLTTVANTLRERERLRRQVKVLSAEGRLSAWILGLLPPVFALYLLLTRPSYLKPLWSTAMGLMLLGLGVVMLAVGVLWMRKAVKVEV